MNEIKGDIMIVDDDAHVRIAVRTILSDAGFNVIAASSGKECINFLKDGFSGVLLLDIMMPEMDGWDTISAILESGLEKRIVIVMLTAKNNPDSKMIGLQEYVIDYLTKPFDNEELIEKVGFFLRYIPK
ncbi:PleD family two-component system response regulator [Methanospirillum stamsii]|uniref:response regulator n=1 Tax=Methanospirillum stamsii TaxID=1277351 RepID=UPI0015E840F4|nr:response regulator [Methanospirillum stamsii]